MLIITTMLIIIAMLNDQVRGTSQLTCKAIQETLSASSLNTNDCFVLVNPDQVVMIMILMIRDTQHYFVFVKEDGNSEQ